MNKISNIAVVVTVALFFIAGAIADTKVIDSSVLEVSSSPGTVYQRWFTTAKPDINPNCEGACPTKPCDTGVPGMTSCQLTFNTNREGFRAYSEDLINFGDALFGTVMQAVFDLQVNGGAGNHQGYYAWNTGAVDSADTSTWFALDCAGGSIASCVGAANATNARAITGVPERSGAVGGILRNVGGFSPLPVPRATDLDGDGNAYTRAGVKGTFQIGWDAVSSTGKTVLNAAGYDVYYAKSTSAGSCPAPTDSEFTFLKTVTGTTAEVGFAEVGLASADDPACVTFGLKVHFGNTSGAVRIVSRYVSANGQSFATSGLSANVYELVAKYAGKSNVEVTWRTSLEDGVRGFYVSRATTQNGPFTRVSELIAAKSEASAYSFIDAVQMPPGAVKATGLWYKVETIDIDDNAVEYGPTKTQLPGPNRDAIIKQRTVKPKR